MWCPYRPYCQFKSLMNGGLLKHQWRFDITYKNYKNSRYIWRTLYEIYITIAKRIMRISLRLCWGLDNLPLCVQELLIKILVAASHSIWLKSLSGGMWLLKYFWDRVQGPTTRQVPYSNHSFYLPVCPFVTLYFCWYHMRSMEILLLV